MARTKTSQKHPALAESRRKRMENTVAVQDDAALEGLDGWDTFNEWERKFILLLPYFGGNRSSTIEYIFPTRDSTFRQNWYHNHCKISPKFKAASELRVIKPVELYRNFLVNLLGKTALRLDEMLEPNGAPPDVQLKAIQHIHRSLNLDGPQLPNGGTFIQNQFVIPTVVQERLQRKESPKQEVVESISTIVDMPQADDAEA
jgi:hypothetical protein